MDTGKQINVMVVVLFIAVIVVGAYTIWDPFRSESAEDDQRLQTAERGATIFAKNCRLCHGDQGQGAAGNSGRLPAALPVNTDLFKGIENGEFSQELLDSQHGLAVDTITCGRVDTQMPFWAESRGGTLSDEQIRQLVTLITGSPEEDFWHLAQEHADEIDAVTTGHATVQQDDGVFSADETALVVSNAGPFAPGQYIRIRLPGEEGEERMRILPKQLLVERGVEGTEAAEHPMGEAIARLETAEGEEALTGEALGEEIGPEDTGLVVSDLKGFDVGELLLLNEEIVRVTGTVTGVPTTGQVLAAEVGRSPGSLLVSRPDNIDPGAVIRLDGELMRVESVRDDGDPGMELDIDLPAEDDFMSVSDPEFFRPDYVVRLGDELVRVLEAADTGQVLVDPLGRAQTSFPVGGIEGLSADMLIRIDGELMRVIEVQPALVKVERGASDETGAGTQPAPHSAGAAILMTDAEELAENGDEEIQLETGVMLADDITDAATTLVANGTSGIMEGETFQIDDELVQVQEIEFARVRVERAVQGTKVAAHARRISIFDGNLLRVERGFNGTSRAAHPAGEPMFFTVIDVERAVEGSDHEQHAKGAEVFLGNALMVERGALGTEPADHPNDSLVLDFPPPPDNPPLLDESCGVKSRLPQVTATPGEQEPTPTSGGPTPTPGGPTVTPEPTEEVGQEVDVSLFEFAVEPDTSSVSAGSVTFNATNNGVAPPHNLRVIATELAADSLPQSGGMVDEASQDLEVVGGSADFLPGESESVTVDLVPGNYVLICNVLGHYAAGMSVEFEVTAP